MTPPAKKPTVAPSKQAPKKPREDDDEDEAEELDEPEQVNDDEDEAAEPKPTPVPIDPSDEKMATTGDLKSAMAASKKALDEDKGRDVQLLDSAKAAALQRQADWEKDAKDIFREEDLSKKRKAKFLEDIGAMDLKNQAEQRELQKEATERKIAADKKLMAEQAKELREEADRLDKLAAGHKAEKHQPDPLKHTTAAHAA